MTDMRHHHIVPAGQRGFGGGGVVVHQGHGGDGGGGGSGPGGGGGGDGAMPDFFLVTEGFRMVAQSADGKVVNVIMSSVPFMWSLI